MILCLPALAVKNLHSVKNAEWSKLVFGTDAFFNLLCNVL